MHTPGIAREKAREMLERSRKDLVIHQIVATCNISDNLSISLLQDSKQEVHCEGLIDPSHFAETFVNEIGTFDRIQENQRHFAEFSSLKTFHLLCRQFCDMSMTSAGIFTLSLLSNCFDPPGKRDQTYQGRSQDRITSKRPDQLF
jgi:hypothetical protein